MEATVAIVATVSQVFFKEGHEADKFPTICLSTVRDDENILLLYPSVVFQQLS
jgi:hypothetical protein